jgi:hypothetical protein
MKRGSKSWKLMEKMLEIRPDLTVAQMGRRINLIRSTNAAKQMSTSIKAQ